MTTIKNESIVNLVNRNDFSEIELAAIPFNTLADAYGSRLAAEQLALEHEAYTLGEARFLKQLDRQVQAGELADNAAAKPLVSSLVPLMATHTANWIDASFYDTDPETGVKKGKRGKRSVSQVLLKDIDPNILAVVTIKCALKGATMVSNIQGVAATIGRSLEDEVHYGKLRDLEVAHFKKNVQPQLEKRVGLIYKKAFMQVVEADMLAKGLVKAEDHWQAWSTEDRVQVGVKCIELLIESTGLVELDRVNAGVIGADAENIKLSDKYADIIATRASALAGISPIHQPCVVPPKPWVETRGGGYWANARRPLALVRTHSAKDLKRYNDVFMPEVYKAINLAQSTAWKINLKVLTVANAITQWKHCPVQDVPAAERPDMPIKPDDIDENPEALKAWKKAASAIYRLDKARVSKRLSMEFMLEQANKFKGHEAIWFPMNLDWRGRVYAVPQFNPQGNDMTKGLLTLAEGKPIGEKGFYWLKVHGANCAGIDKVPFPERIAFIEANHSNILASAQDPLVNTWWAEQDSPFCFLAFCFEYAMVNTVGLGYECSLPLAFDGSCSGIQHFSAMLRDEVGGRAVNLLPSDTVEDIYRIVSDKVNVVLNQMVINGDANEVETLTDKKTGEITERLKLGSKALAGQWLTYGVNRSVTKRSVMTLAYGSKEFGFRQQILEDTIQPAIDTGKGHMFVNPMQAAGFMAKLIWDAVSTTVVAAVGAMEWLRAAARLLAAEVVDKKTKEVLRPRCAIHWTTLDGFPVWQEYHKQDTKRLNLLFLGQFRLQPTVSTGRGYEIDAHKQESGISPNFVHSQDGNHLRMTVVHANEAYGIDSFALIHDSFGTIPADADNLFKAVRETMVTNYEKSDVLAEFYQQFADQLHESQLDKMPALPPKGTLDLQQILKSDFAFA
ncbi:DNA-directed RNA polymerase [Pectobacterium phage Jarilo]|uniref:DNA-directed RNA polymerase n=1 Tax=Pectobacterium phage Jarilo TaxID=2163634 RepID=A0A2S1GSW7_9CAUD|nr:RNA polymerase [Pectobacterium phage Jarilo]AWD92487.1 DNA-directed RNA polymerase [Pectobacterium phage Jarilo]